MFSIAICDNDEKVLQLLMREVKLWLDRFHPEEGSLSIFSDSGEILEVLYNGRSFDLYLLDVIMPQVTGIQLGNAIRRRDLEAAIVYITSYREYAFEAYGLHAIRYLTKPIQQEELWSALDFSYSLFLNKRSPTMIVKGYGTLTSVTISNIMYAENDVREVFFSLRDGKKIVGVRREGSFEDAVAPLLNMSYFVQVHKSYCVNLYHIDTLHADKITMDDGAMIPISRKHLSLVKNKYMEFVLRGGKML